MSELRRLSIDLSDIIEYGIGPLAGGFSSGSNLNVIHCFDEPGRRRRRAWCGKRKRGDRSNGTTAG
ncbi:MAG: hypothetical protein M3509_02300, partial [Chloroflexota bacterium]|nr:hypothetical protein [Chloroflexota bacterium]